MEVLAGGEAENKQALAEDTKEAETALRTEKSTPAVGLYRLTVDTSIPALHRCGS